MKNIQIEHIGANVNLNYPVTFGNNNAFEATLIIQVWLTKSKNGKYIIDSVGFCDISDIKFLGVEIEKGYQAFRNWKEQILKLGIDFNKLVDAEYEKINQTQLKQYVLKMFNK